MEHNREPRTLTIGVVGVSTLVEVLSVDGGHGLVTVAPGVDAVTRVVSSTLDGAADFVGHLSSNKSEGSPPIPVVVGAAPGSNWLDVARACTQYSPRVVAVGASPQQVAGTDVIAVPASSSAQQIVSAISTTVTLSSHVSQVGHTADVLPVAPSWGAEHGVQGHGVSVPIVPERDRDPFVAAAPEVAASEGDRLWNTATNMGQIPTRTPSVSASAPSMVNSERLPLDTLGQPVRAEVVHQAQSQPAYVQGAVAEPQTDFSQVNPQVALPAAENFQSQPLQPQYTQQPVQQPVQQQYNQPPLQQSVQQQPVQQYVQPPVQPQPVQPQQYTQPPVQQPAQQQYVQQQYTQQQQPVAPPLTTSQDYGFDPFSNATQHVGVKRARILVVWSARGGPGKTTYSAALADTAAENGHRVLLIDGNIGQSDQRLLLGLQERIPIPTLWDAAQSGVMTDAITSSVRLAEVRRNAAPVKFSLVAAPLADRAKDPRINPQLLNRLIEEVSPLFDLIVIDTQMVESSRDEMTDDFVAPLVASGAYSLGLSDGSVPGVEHLLRQINFFISRGAQPDQMMVVFNKIPHDSSLSTDKISERLYTQHHIRTVGVSWYDEELISHSNSGEALRDARPIAYPVEVTLNHVLGDPVTSTPWSPHVVRRRSWWPFGRRKGGK